MNMIKNTWCTVLSWMRDAFLKSSFNVTFTVSTQLFISEVVANIGILRNADFRLQDGQLI